MLERRRCVRGSPCARAGLVARVGLGPRTRLVARASLLRCIESMCMNFSALISLIMDSDLRNQIDKLPLLYSLWRVKRHEFLSSAKFLVMDSGLRNQIDKLPLLVSLRRVIPSPLELELASLAQGSNCTGMVRKLVK